MNTSNFADRGHSRRLTEKPCPKCYSRMEEVKDGKKVIGYICPRHGFIEPDK